MMGDGRGGRGGSIDGIFATTRSGTVPQRDGTDTQRKMEIFQANSTKVNHL
jgi:hypothetical protein